MTPQLHLPDLPEVPVALGDVDGEPAAPGPRARAPREAWSSRLRGLLTTYLPLLLMSLLAAATWWLARHAPKPPNERPAQAARHDPDYTAQRVTMRRYNPQGKLAIQIEGEQVRHYPDTDEIEVDTVHLSATGPDGRRTRATARQAVAAGDNSRYSLEGGARVVSTGADGHVVEIEGEHLLVLARERKLRSDRPVTVRQGGSELVADAMDFDEVSQQLLLHGRVKARLLPVDMRAPKP